MCSHEGYAETLFTLLISVIFVFVVFYLTIWPAPITPSFLISAPATGVEENWRERDASLCEATLDLEFAMILDKTRAEDAMGEKERE